ncbi:hypothetical protein DASC09_037770 [Saccharomycopsis crataegensis]|uniref:Uncharacterized protein n=1 Tax=Saccharomycopsis crataegensis TaxID=43959 RepID=A0AAV5QPE2_9ASCO|nr:hypothetical protein DASC09_037770 [Saccharomycopsis crataegensis]
MSDGYGGYQPYYRGSYGKGRGSYRGSNSRGRGYSSYNGGRGSSYDSNDGSYYKYNSNKGYRGGYSNGGSYRGSSSGQGISKPYRGYDANSNQYYNPNNNYKSVNNDPNMSNNFGDSLPSRLSKSPAPIKNYDAGSLSLPEKLGSSLNTSGPPGSTGSSGTTLSNVTVKTSKDKMNLDSSRIWAKLLKISDIDVTTGVKGIDVPKPKYKEKAFIDKFKKDLDELDEINKKMDEAFLARITKEWAVENLGRFERNGKLLSQLRDDGLEKIVASEGLFSEFG